MFHNDQVRGGFRGGWWHGGRTLSSHYGFDPLSTQRVTPLYYFEIYILVTDLKNFLEATDLKNFLLILRRGRVPKKRDFLVKILQKVPNAFLASFFSKFCLRPRKIYQNRLFLVLWESLENLFGRLFWKFDPLEKILDPPLDQVLCDQYCKQFSKKYFVFVL